MNHPEATAAPCQSCATRPRFSGTSSRCWHRHLHLCQRDQTGVGTSSPPISAVCRALARGDHQRPHSTLHRARAVDGADGTAFLLLIGVGVEISLMFFDRGAGAHKLLPPDPKTKILA